MDTRVVLCPANEELAAFLVEKREEWFVKQYSDNLDSVFIGAHKNVCESTVPLTSLRAVSKVKGIGKWLLKILAEFYKPDEDMAEDEDEEQPGGSQRAKKAPKRYLPKKNSGPYALLITLYRAYMLGKEFMMRQELIDAAEASGLSTMPIEPSKGLAPQRYGGGPQFSYSGWNSMKTLTEKGLVVKKSNPAKYMLTEEGRKTAEECQGRSGLGPTDYVVPTPANEVPSVNVRQGPVRTERATTSRARPSKSKSSQKATAVDFNKLKTMGYKEEDIQAAVNEATATSGLQDSDIWGFVLGILSRGGGFHVGAKEKAPVADVPVSQPTVQPVVDRGTVPSNSSWYHSAPAATVEATVRSTSTAGPSNPSNTRSQGIEASATGGNELAVPPLGVGQAFGQVYEVFLVLDSREQFRRDARGGAALQKFADRIGVQFKVQVETRQLPVGDALWIARHKDLRHEYVLDFIVERKRVDDLWSSIKDGRYKQQKLRLQRCGVKRLVYLIEGDPNLTDASDSLKTAAFTTEILEGFDVQRTRDVSETTQKYGELTTAIIDRYSEEVGKPGRPRGGHCMRYVEFVEYCKDIEMERVTDVFGVQLMQVRNVTEEMALAILERYPTLYSLVVAYTELEGDVQAQELLLTDIQIRNKNKTISAIISKNIYKLVWAP
ncbi:hypothetical protein KC19_5G088600 [Ceratodon purpureus]|uniref:Crossover junction endonuclease MUS81 n=1 Tax=Ceratodon purpureus TaxID=3225 RepID=A0A8T0HZF3_CERPU|nr:hypothetical protein KC19_5G088600 [Ceratodon purpureus]